MGFVRSLAVSTSILTRPSLVNVSNSRPVALKPRRAAGAARCLTDPDDISQILISLSNLVASRVPCGEKMGVGTVLPSTFSLSSSLSAARS